MDNELRNIEKKTVDRGWSAMRDLLDREMPAAPAERRRRWPLWFWLGLMPGLLAGIGLATWAATGLQSPAAPLPAPAAPQPVFPKNQPVALAAPQVILPEKTAPQRAEKTATLAQKPSGKRLLPAAHSSREIAQFSSETAQHTEAIPTETAAAHLTPAQTSEPQASPPALAVLAQNGALLLQKDLKKPSMGELPAPIFPEKPAAKQPSAWAFGLEASSIFGQTSRPTGFHVGGVADWKFAAKFGLRAGIGYSFLQTPATSGAAQFIQVETAKYLAETGDSSAVLDTAVQPSTSASSAVFIPITRQHRLEFPLLLWARPLQKWQATAGIVASRTVRAYSGDTRLTDSRVYQLASEESEDIAEKSNALVQSVFPKWGAAWEAGVAFLPTKNLEIGLSFRQNFQKSPSDSVLASAFDAPGNTLTSAEIIAQPTQTRSPQVRARVAWFF